MGQLNSIGSDLQIYTCALHSVLTVCNIRAYNIGVKKKSPSKGADWKVSVLGEAMELMTCVILTQEMKGKIEAPINPSLIKKNKVTRYGTGEYLPVDVYRKLLNEIFGYTWSWEIIDRQVYEHPQGSFYIEVLGRLSIPGIGVKEAYGSQPITDPKNHWSQGSKMAASYALKNACKMVGIGDIDDDDALFASDVQEAPKTTPAPAPATNTPATTTATQTKPKATFTQAQIDAMKEFKSKYSIKDNTQLAPFIKAWNPELSSVTDLNGDNVDSFIKWINENAERLAKELGF